jgi:hypothetical protein
MYIYMYTSEVDEGSRITLLFYAPIHSYQVHFIKLLEVVRII